MKSLKKILCATALIAGGVAAYATELPYSQNFKTQDDFNTWSVINVVEASPAWKFNQYGGYDYDGAAYYNGSASEYPADDYLVSPAIDLEAGKAYEFKFMYQGNYSTQETFEVRMGQSATAEGLSTLVGQVTIPDKSYSFETKSYWVIPETTGTYYFAFKATSPVGSGTMYIDNVSVSTGKITKAPGLVSDVTSEVKSVDGKVSVDLSFTAPTTDFGGAVLTELTSVKVSRGATLLGTITEGVAAGAKLTFTDENPLSGSNAYSIVCSNSYGDGDVVNYTTKVTFAKPSAVAKVNAVREGNTVTLNWDAVTTAEGEGLFSQEDVTYTVSRVNGTQTPVTLASNLKETTLKDAITIDEGAEGQMVFIYTVEAVNHGVSSDKASSESIVVGEAYKGGYSESFSKYSFDTNTWVEMQETGSTKMWDCISSTTSFSYPSSVTPQDGDQGMLRYRSTTYSGKTNSRMISPLINVSTLKNPCLSFYIYKSASSTKDDCIDVELLSEGKYVSLIEHETVKGEETGWTKVKAFIPSEVAAKDFQIVFNGKYDVDGGYSSYDVLIDNITVENALDNNLAALSMTAPAKVAIGKEYAVSVEVKNLGAKAVESYSVQLKRGEEVVDEAKGSAIDVETVQTVSFTAVASPVDAGKDVEYTAEIVYSADEDEADNTATCVVSILENAMPVPTKLGGTYSNNEVTLEWTKPEISTETQTENVSEGFETYTKDSTEAPEGWTYINVNEVDVTYNYANLGKQVFSVNGDYAHTGSQCLACYKANSYSDKRDAWLISPQVIGSQTVSFYTAALKSYSYYANTFGVYYSTGGTEVSDFIQIGSDYGFKTDDWNKVEFELPADAVYFAIHVKDVNTNAMFLDDFTFIKGTKPLELTGYNIYRDNVKVGSTDANTTTFVDKLTPAEGQQGMSLAEATGTEYNYAISAVYATGESKLSEILVVKPVTSGVDAIESDVDVYAKGGVLYVKGQNGQDFAIYGLNGMQLYNGKVNGENQAFEMAKGMYIVKIGGKAFKVMVK